jgi:hypothetical protein
MRVLNCRHRREREELTLSGGEHGREVEPKTRDDDMHQVDKKIADLQRHFSQYWTSLR